MKDYKYENAYQRYTGRGWAYSSDEKKQKIAKERAIVKNDALFCKQVLYDCRDKITNEYVEIFEELLKEEQDNLAFYYDYGLLAYMNNNFDKSSELFFALIDHAQKNNQIDQLNAKVYHDLGSVCMEVMAYDKAIKYLSDAIRLDPNNKETYFRRAIAYFETGQFDLAIDDYLISDKIKTGSYSKNPSKDFTKALCASLCQGAAESAIDFVPSLCSTTYGIGKTLWATAQAPIESTKAFSSACYEMGKCFVEYCKTLDSNTIIDQLKELYSQFDHLSDSEKGKLIGYTIGKYGVDIFAGGFVVGGAIKGGKILVSGTSAYRKLKNVNRACNLEAMTISSTNKEKIVAESLKHAAERENYFKNVRYNFDAHNKHIRGHNDFIKTGSEWEHQNPEQLLRFFAGKGIPGGNRSPGTYGYRETVDFGEHIGIWRSLDGKIQLPTTRGTIHYGKKGAHIVPSKPNSEIHYQ
jgi:tetratricopeptide (TPR) repeat protein